MTFDYSKLLAMLPAMVAAYQSTYVIWNKAHPDEFAAWVLKHPGGTRDQYEDERFEQFNAELLKDAVDVQKYSVEWFVAHGYVRVDGKWVKRA